MVEIELVNDLIPESESTFITRKVGLKKKNKFKKENSYSKEEQELELIDNSLLESNLAKVEGPISLDDIVNNQRKTRLILDKFDKVDSRVSNLRSTIEKQLSDYDIQIDISKDPLLCTAVKKIFKKSLKYINKEMYLIAVDKLKEIQEQRIDKELEDE